LRSLGLTHTPTGGQVDHVVPLAKGGPDQAGNLQLLCGAALRAKKASELQ
jgi:5-methylcytosine-specific restriction endonuclease McrA